MKKLNHYFFKTLLLFVWFLSSVVITKTSGQKVEKDKETAVISFIFDDLNSCDFDVKSIFDEYGFKPSFALTANKIDSSTIQLYKAFFYEGISILSHSYSHPRMNSVETITKDELLLELTKSKQIIESYGINVTGFVTPYSFMHPDFLTQLDSIYDYAFTNNNNDVFNRSVNKHHLSRYGIESNISSIDHNIDKIAARIDTAILNNQLLVFYGHKIPSSYLDDKGNSRVTKNDLRKILSYTKAKVESGECIVLPSDMAVKKYYALNHRFNSKQSDDY